MKNLGHELVCEKRLTLAVVDGAGVIRPSYRKISSVWLSPLPPGPSQAREPE
jgi:hypothetical protein